MAIRTFLFILSFLFTCVILKAQTSSFTIEYSHAYGVDFNMDTCMYRKDATLYINNDTLSYFESLPIKKGQKDVGKRCSPHSHYCLINQKLDIEGFLPHSFLVERPFENFHWQLTNDSLLIAGFICYKAISDSIVVWYTPKLKANVGPFWFNGLPGIILQVHELSRHWKITASKVNYSSPQIILPSNQKRLSEKEYRAYRKSI